MNTHNNARLTPKGREEMVRSVVEHGSSVQYQDRKFPPGQLQPALILATDSNGPRRATRRRLLILVGARTPMIRMANPNDSDKPVTTIVKYTMPVARLSNMKNSEA